MSNQLYDVIVVGAGPAGSHAARLLAASGYSVAVFEQKSAPGLNACCTGIISAGCLDSFDIGPEVIRGRANAASFFSPLGKRLRLQSERVQACIVDRASLDLALAEKAQARGARYFFSSRVTDIAIEHGMARIEALHRGSPEISVSRAIVLANGFNPALSQKLGLGRIKRFAAGAQVEVKARDIDEVEVYFSQEMAPGFFAWLVPASPGKALAGLLSTSHAKLHLEKFLHSPSCRDRITSQESEIRQKAIPVGILPHTCGDRMLVIGDAAGQVKPTTGGGIYFGQMGAEIASKVLAEALERDDLSSARLYRYQKEWQARMGREIALDYRARWAYTKLSDSRIEKMFDILSSGNIAESLLKSPDFSFDWHGKLMLSVLKRGAVHYLRKAWHTPPREARLW
ncbi:MAG: NAD(P)/FAD-dependent oxidoreductase [Dehalococcoidia bacterium]|nr:NAD(P)/FAD-dependent oxidoreductase [Dehalococcoidia bacterium]